MPAHRLDHTFADYLALEAGSNIKHAYVDGQIYATSGGTPDHGALEASVILLVGSQIRGGRCRPLTSDVRVRVLATGLATYPDVTIVCGPRELDPEDKNTVTNPTLVVEVLSRSTERYDRGDKFEHYKHIPSLRQYVLVSHREHLVEVWTRGEDGGWALAAAREGDIADLASIGARLNVTELYESAAEPAA